MPYLQKNGAPCMPDARSTTPCSLRSEEVDAHASGEVQRAWSELERLEGDMAALAAAPAVEALRNDLSVLQSALHASSSESEARGQALGQQVASLRVSLRLAASPAVCCHGVERGIPPLGKGRGGGRFCQDILDSNSGCV